MSHSPGPRHRAILLGASNVARNLPVVVETVRRVCGQPVDVLAAIGHGRSYGRPSRVLGRSLPGILQCDLWQDWRTRPALPTAALLTDIGNDILFGAPPDRIAAWVEECLMRLKDDCERLVITELPLASVLNVGPRKYVALRTILFPRSQVSWEQALDAARQLNGYVTELAQRWGATIVRPPRDWYGFDPIHIRVEHGCAAWGRILAPWGSGEVCCERPPTWRERIRWYQVRPKYRRLFGIEQQQEQPAVRLQDGTQVSLY